MDIHITLREVCSPHRTDRADTATSVDCLTEKETQAASERGIHQSIGVSPCALR